MPRSSTTARRIPNPPQGEILARQFLEPTGLSQNALPRAIRVPLRRINEIGGELAAIRPRAA